MIKRVNFTGRRRIAHRLVQIDIRGGSPPTFDAKIDLDGTQMPAGAKVYLGIHERRFAGGQAI